LFGPVFVTLAAASATAAAASFTVLLPRRAFRLLEPGGRLVLAARRLRGFTGQAYDLLRGLRLVPGVRLAPMLPALTARAFGPPFTALLIPAAAAAALAIAPLLAGCGRFAARARLRAMALAASALTPTLPLFRARPRRVATHARRRTHGRSLLRFRNGRHRVSGLASEPAEYLADDRMIVLG
jgi:hypothetical protein